MKAKKTGLILAACLLLLGTCGERGGQGGTLQGTDDDIATIASNESNEGIGIIGQDIESGSPEESVTADQGEPDELNGKKEFGEGDEIKETISNNGGYFVGVEDKVYYREYGEYSLEGSTLYGDFLAYGVNYGGASIKCYQPGMAQATTIQEWDDGYGRLYYRNGYLYSVRDENFDVATVYRINVENGDSEKVANGSILGGSTDGRYLAVQEYLDGKFCLSILDEGKPGDGSYVPISGYFNYVGSDGDKVFFVLFSGDEDDNAYLMQYDYAGNLANLAKLPRDENLFMAAPEAHHFVCENGKLSFTWEYYEGTGHFLASAFKVEIPVCTNPSGADASTPLYQPQAEMIEIWSDAQQGDYSETYLKLQGSDPWVEAITAEQTKWPKDDGRGVALIPQTVERVNGGIYCMAARAHRDGLEDIGWREAYSLMEMKYLFYPNEGSQPVELAKVSLSEGPLTGYVWLIGKAGEKATQVIYQQAIFMGPETMPEEDAYLYGAELSPDLVYEFPEEGDIYGDWARGNLEDFYDMIKRNKKNYVSKAPALNGYQGYEKSASWSTNSVMPFHFGFDEEGRISYLRPVVMD